MSKATGLSISDKQKAELEINSKNLQQNLAKLGIKIGYKILDDGLILSVDMESLVEAIFKKYPSIYRNYAILGERYLLIEMR